LSVSKEERDLFIDAVKQLNQMYYSPTSSRTDFPAGHVSYWFKQDEIHQSSHVHGCPAFLPWHVELCNRFEALLRTIHPELSLHYWDWNLDPSNMPDGEGGGIALVHQGSNKPSLIEMRTSLVAGNRASSRPDISGMLTSDGYNLIQNVSGATFTPNKQHFTDVLEDLHTDLRIDPALSGKLTQIHALLSGSPAIDRIPLDACHINGIDTDQLGDQRPDGSENTCDIGAFYLIISCCE